MTGNTVSIAYPFLTAGARGVLVSLWPVEDRATPLLMGKFYENWLGEARMSKARALQSAKEWLRSCEAPDGIRRYEHPAYWSSFILVGG